MKTELAEKQKIITTSFAGKKNSEPHKHIVETLACSQYENKLISIRKGNGEGLLEMSPVSIFGGDTSFRYSYGIVYRNK